MSVVARLDEIGKPAWIGLTILAFMAYWPLGIAAIAFLIGSGRIGCGARAFGRWHNTNAPRSWPRAGGWRCGAAPSGNRAFDDYRADTLRRLEEEEREFRDFLDRLRVAKDKAEFDEFLAERRRRSEGTPPPA